jgi:hypothetical protein
MLNQVGGDSLHTMDEFRLSRVRTELQMLLIIVHRLRHSAVPLRNTHQSYRVPLKRRYAWPHRRPPSHPAHARHRAGRSRRGSSHWRGAFSSQLYQRTLGRNRFLALDEGRRRGRKSQPQHTAEARGVLHRPARKNLNATRHWCCGPHQLFAAHRFREPGHSVGRRLSQPEEPARRGTRAITSGYFLAM